MQPDSAAGVCTHTTSREFGFLDWTAGPCKEAPVVVNVSAKMERLVTPEVRAMRYSFRKRSAVFRPAVGESAVSGSGEVLFQKFQKGLPRERTRKIVALNIVTAGTLQECVLLRCFNAFGNNPHAQFMSHLDDGS